MISPKQLYAGVLTGAVAVVYTVPAGKTAIVQMASIVNASSAAPIVNILIGGIEVARNTAMTTDQVVIVEAMRRHVLEAGQTVSAGSTIAGIVGLIISGVEVDA